MALTFDEQLTITIIDKGVIGLLLLAAGLAFNRMLEGFKSVQTKAIEALRSDLTRKVELDRERRTAIADFAKKVSAGFQAMEWLTWKAKYSPKSFSKLDVAGYNDDMKGSFPQIVAARVVASAVDIERAGVTEALALRLYKLDSELAMLCVRYVDADDLAGQSAALATIGDMHERITDEDQDFVAKISEFASMQQPPE